MRFRKIAAMPVPLVRVTVKTDDNSSYDLRLVPLDVCHRMFKEGKLSYDLDDQRYFTNVVDGEVPAWLAEYNRV